MIESYASQSKGNENWKDIPGYDGIYQASSMGRIRSKPGKITGNARYPVRHWKSRILKPKLGGTIRKDYRVTLWKDNKPKYFLVARLVALTWVPGYEDGLTVNHINGDYLDNRAENLEWVSRESNIVKGFGSGLYGSIMKPILLITTNSKIYEFDSMAEASRFLGRNNGYVSGCVKRNRCASSVSGEAFRIEVRAS